MPFIDEAKFFVKAGDGGRGCVSFRREKFVAKGGPDGGDGGDGGDVILEASRRLHSLIDFKYRSHFLAKSGSNGSGKKMHGRNGADCVVKVPLGSVIKDAETGEVFADLAADGDRYIAAAGGRGGPGNCHFASGRNRTPRFAGPGTPGVERWLRIELKLLADVGLIGLPNAGKSTLLSKLSAANPKVADYPFTTLEPQLGVLHLAENRPCIIADIPGLIEGAHDGAGLGHKFLKHVERTRVLLHVVDAASHGAEPVADFKTLENELREYDELLLQRRQLVVLNKIDLLASDEALRALEGEFAKLGVDTISISALNGEHLEALKGKIEELLQEPESADEPDNGATDSVEP